MTDKQPIDHVKGEFFLLQKLRAQREVLDAEIKRLEGIIRTEGGDAEELTIDGNTVALFPYVSKLRTKELEKENPDLYKQYLEPKLVDTFNAARFQQEHPELYRRYQSRSFRPK